MDPKLDRRPQWEIDKVLDGLIGEDIRVAARSFAPAARSGQKPRPFIPVHDLILPDNSQPASTPVFFEGRLRQFKRRIGVVFVSLDSATSQERASDGLLCFRGKTAVILRGPAVVELAFPFRVERLPADAHNYWRDLRIPHAQFEFPFSPDGGDGQNGSRDRCPTTPRFFTSTVCRAPLWPPASDPERTATSGCRST